MLKLYITVTYRDQFCISRPKIVKTDVLFKPEGKQKLALCENMVQYASIRIWCNMQALSIFKNKLSILSIKIL